MKTEIPRIIISADSPVSIDDLYMLNTNYEGLKVELYILDYSADSKVLAYRIDEPDTPEADRTGERIPVILTQYTFWEDATPVEKIITGEFTMADIMVGKFTSP